MQRGTLLSKEKCFLILDIYLGGVDAVLVENKKITKNAHAEIALSTEDPVATFLLQAEDLIQESIANLSAKAKDIPVLVSVAPPLSHSTKEEVTFSETDKNFFNTSYTTIYDKELVLPMPHKNILQNFAHDGVIVEHPPENRTINGYATKNLEQKGIRSADLYETWIQGTVYNAIEKVKIKYSLGSMLFVAPYAIQNTFIFGPYMSCLYVEDNGFLVGIGTETVVRDVAKELSLSVYQVKDVLKGILRGHIEKEIVYKKTKHLIDTAIENTVRFAHIDVYKKYLWRCTTNDLGFDQILRDALYDHRNITLQPTSNSIITHILKNTLQ